MECEAQQEADPKDHKQAGHHQERLVFSRRRERRHAGGFGRLRGMVFG
jgi:hypothetical protein